MPRASGHIVSGTRVSPASSPVSSERKKCEETHGQDAHATTTHGRHAHAARAFTLFELLTVLLLLGVILTLSAPSLSGFFAGRETADAAQSLLSLTKAAHSISVSQGQLCRLNIDSASGSFWLTVQEGANFVPAPGDAGRRFVVPQGTRLSFVQSSTPAVGMPPPAVVGYSPSLNVGPGAQAKTVNYIDFYSTGRNDVATIEITGRGRQVFQVACPCATESFSLISPSEAK